MIGLVMRGLFGGGPGIVSIVVGTLVAFCAIWGCCKLSSCKLRDCSCIKRILRCTGADEFDDFEVCILVHEVKYVSSNSIYTAVRIRAGDQVAETDSSQNGTFQEPLSIYIEQGCSSIDVDFINASSHQVLATFTLDIASDILNPQERILQKVYTMKQKNKGIVNPKCMLSIHTQSDEEAMNAIIGGKTFSEETDVVLRKQLAGKEGENLSELELLASGCCGPVESYGAWGSKDGDDFLMVTGPPKEKKFILRLWDKEVHANATPSKKGGATKPKAEVPVLRITSVQADPGRSDVFRITYVDKARLHQHLTLRRVDRSRDAWIELLQELIKTVRQRKDEEHEDSGSGTQKTDKKDVAVTKTKSWGLFG